MSDNFVLAGTYSDLKKKASMTVQLNGHTIALFDYAGDVYAVDNRCPHMGFPLDKGQVNDGILTCYWHYARFDVVSGGTFDQWADDVRSFPVEIRGDHIWLDLSPPTDPKGRQRRRLQVGLERDIPLVIGKAVLVLMDDGGNAIEPFKTGIEFGTRYRQNGWGQGLTMLTCFMNMLPRLDLEDRPRAMYQGLSAVARDSINHPTRFTVDPLPNEDVELATLKRWFRNFVEVRDAEGSERCVVSAIRAGATDRDMADMLFAAATDHRYIDVGHPLDFTNKALEALDIIGWEHAETVLTSLVRGYTVAMRQEESNAWRYPIDLVAILETAFEQLPTAFEAGQTNSVELDRAELVNVLMGDDPQATVDHLLDCLTRGVSAETLAQTVTYASALRIARFHTSNEFPDWDTALHTFTFSNAVYQGLRRSASAELTRGVFDAAMSIYLDRFLNIPAAKLPVPNGAVDIANEFPKLLNNQQQVNQAAGLVTTHLHHDGNPDELLAMLGKLLLREDRDFHTIQSVEAAFAMYEVLGDSAEATHVLIAAARYLAAHSPTMRAQGQTWEIARRLHRGDHLFEE